MSDDIIHADKTNFATTAEFVIAKQNFAGVIVHSQNSIGVAAHWSQNHGGNLNLLELLSAFNFDKLPNISSIELPFSEVNIAYRNKVVKFQAVLVKNSIVDSITFRGDVGESSQYSIGLKMNESGLSVKLGDIPVLGKILLPDDKIVMNGITVNYLKKSDEFSFDIDGKIVLFGNDIPCFKGLDNANDQTDAESNGVTWIDLNKKLGGFRLGRLGFSFSDGRVNIHLDAGFAISLLSIDFLELRFGIVLDNPSDFDFGLKGLIVSFNTSLLSITGGLYNSSITDLVRYDGMLMVRIKNVTITAIGSYAEQTDINGNQTTSFFLYASLSAPLGGPPAFFIDGFALGFGVNQRLILPNVEDVPQYPLIAAATGKYGKNTPKDLGKYIKVESGQHFIAAGVKFNSFKIIDGFVLLTASFGNELEIGVLGIADISVPPNISTNPIAKAQLSLKAVFNANQGIFQAEARLTSESYVISKDCKITGGFAAFFWFGKNRYSGDFVITLGGYHPAFQKPDHYPTVPRLGLNWNVTPNLNISGELYFALTPSCIMAGGKLSAVYSAGALKAWFIAYADFLIKWKPFNYDIKIGISVGASVTIDFWLIRKTFSVELSADLHVWGPEFQGTARITWFIISFTISFSKGEDKSKASLDWNGFKKSFLSGDSELDSNTAETSDVITVIIDGVVGKTTGDIDIVDPNNVIVSVNSKIPESGNIRPVNNRPFIAPIVCSITRDIHVNEDGNFSKNQIKQNVPAAMWKKSPASNADILKEKSVVENAVCGIELKPIDQKPELFPKIHYISLDELYKKNTLRFEGSFKFTEEKRMFLSEAESIKKFSENLNNAETIKRRQKFLSTYGITENINLSLFAEDAENLFTEDILLRSCTGYEF